MIHDHKPDEGPGLDCPETLLPTGELRGQCVLTIGEIHDTMTSHQAAALLYLLQGKTAPSHYAVRHVSERFNMNPNQQKAFRIILGMHWKEKY